MDHMVPREREVVIDLESGGTTSEEEVIREPVSGVRKAKNLLDRVWSGFVNSDGSLIGEDGTGYSISNSAAESAELLIEKKSEGEDTVSPLVKKTEKEKRKKKNSKIPPKPPRPPRGPSLDAADQKLIREISELAMLKRARIERMKAHKKMKAAKAASSNSSLYAMVFTILFCLVIIFQGMSSRGSSHLSFQGSPQSAVAMRGRLISIQYYKNVSANATDGPGSASPSLVEQVSGSGPDEEGGRSRVAG
ncbi:hypothetical protein BVC80_379g120 [Macleaya cordata]|uniref:Transmembrane protein n=1 Tax=Macleaya cordata TaxID=56857 RepID=A0A200QT05_MACCD|nr:hypothetical protein BVC80_379g120 [Macleaya cordata]